MSGDEQAEARRAETETTAWLDAIAAQAPAYLSDATGLRLEGGELRLFTDGALMGAVLALRWFAERGMNPTGVDGALLPPLDGPS